MKGEDNPKGCARQDTHEWFLSILKPFMIFLACPGRLMGQGPRDKPASLPFAGQVKGNEEKGWGAFWEAWTPSGTGQPPALLCSALRSGVPGSPRGAGGEERSGRRPWVPGMLSHQGVWGGA